MGLKSSKHTRISEELLTQICETVVPDWSWDTIFEQGLPGRQ
jgi:hypothetical protein